MLTITAKQAQDLLQRQPRDSRPGNPVSATHLVAQPACQARDEPDRSFLAILLRCLGVFPV